MTKSRRTYSREFKLEALRLVETSGKSVAQIERDLGIGRGCLCRWRDEFRAEGQAAFHAFRPEVLAQLRKPQLLPAREIVILGAQHEHNLGQRAVEYDQPRTVRIQVLLEDYTDSYGRVERRLAAYELDRDGEPSQRLGYLPKDAPRRVGRYLATLRRPEGKRRIEGRLSSLKEQGE